MPAEITLELKASQDLAPQMASLFHGVLIEIAAVKPGLADALHSASGRQPFSQYIIKSAQGSWQWHIALLDDSEFTKFMRGALLDLKHFTLKHNGIEVSTAGVTLREVSFASLADLFYRGRPPQLVSVHFLTPAAFKSAGEYVNLPTVRLMLQSLAAKYQAAAQTELMQDDDMLQEMCAKVRIISYALHSKSFALEGVTVPGFMGNLTLKLSGPEVMNAFVFSLLRFGEFSGIGIKTALGMGAIAVSEGFAKRG